MNKYKQLASNTIIFAIGSFGSKILLLFLTKLYTANINPADNSTKELLEITANFLIPLVTFSITESIIRFGLDKRYSKPKVYTNALAVTGIGFLLMLSVSPMLAVLPFVDGYIWLLMLYICTSSLRSVNSQFVRARGLVKLFAFDGILATLTLFIFSVIFIAVLQLGVTGFMLSVICSDFLSAVFLWFVAGLRRYFNPKAVDGRLGQAMLAFSLPLIPSTLLWTITGFSDRIFIRYMPGPDGFVGESAAGIYGIANKIPNLVSMFSTIFFQAWNMSAILENDSKDRGRFYQMVFDAYTSFLFIAGAAMIVFVRPLSDLLIDTSSFPEYGTAYLYTPILISAVIMMCLNQFFSSIYAATKHTTHSLWTSMVAAVTNIILNALLVWLFGLNGAAIATFAGYFISYIIRQRDARSYIYFPINQTKFFINVIVMFALGYIVTHEIPGQMIILTIGMVFMLVFNRSAIVGTLKQIRSR
ncbi:MAG: polysaccharide biosynthesis C-terminal domain-containing protein [Ruminococcus sp.]|nr:polysaccharide biosynthesis C-terminal domain-containing protein [Ruminococcus sp.]